jgi:pimeloyl-ACP methyl ester carboxylesterase
VTRSIIGTGLALAFSLAVLAPSSADEAAVTAGVLARDPPGARVWLTVGQERFLALELEALGDAVPRAVVVVHGIGSDPDAPGVVQAVRRRLPHAGWRTVSIQLPAVAPDALAGDLEWWERAGAARVRRAVGFLVESGASDIALLAHGSGAAACARFFAEGGDPRVGAMIGVSPVYALGGGGVPSQDLGDAWPPRVLEVYADRDLLPVREQVARHARLAPRAEAIDLRQVEIGAARHGLAGREDEVYRWVRGWLEKAP